MTRGGENCLAPKRESKVLKERRKMKVAVLVEWDNPKDESRLKRYNEMQREPWPEWLTKLLEEINMKSSSWADNTGHIVNLHEFENMEAFAKLWDSEEWHKRMIRLNLLVDNMRIRFLRPSITMPE